jgi:hypothetical protein
MSRVMDTISTLTGQVRKYEDSLGQIAALGCANSDSTPCGKCQGCIAMQTVPMEVTRKAEQNMAPLRSTPGFMEMGFVATEDAGEIKHWGIVECRTCHCIVRDACKESHKHWHREMDRRA